MIFTTAIAWLTFETAKQKKKKEQRVITITIKISLKWVWVKWMYEAEVIFITLWCILGDVIKLQIKYLNNRYIKYNKSKLLFITRTTMIESIWDKNEVIYVKLGLYL